MEQGEFERTSRDLEATRAWLNDRMLAKQIGVRCVELSPGYSLTEFDPPDEWRNPNGSLPGAMLAAFADHAAGFAAVSAIGPEDYAVTVDLDTRFVRAAFRAPIRAESWVTRKGRRLAFLRFEMREPDGTLVADGIASFFVESGLGNAHPIGRDE